MLGRNMDASWPSRERNETNILAALLARRMGVKEGDRAEVENLNYISSGRGHGHRYDRQQEADYGVEHLPFTMSSDVQAIKYLTGSEAEVMEFALSPTRPPRAAASGGGLPEHDVIIGGIVRGDRSKSPSELPRSKAFDRVVVFALPDAVETGVRFLID